MPVNGLIIRALLMYYLYYGDNFTIECPTGSGQRMNLYQVAEELSRRLTSIFLRDNDGRRPVYGESPKFSGNPTIRPEPHPSPSHNPFVASDKHSVVKQFNGAKTTGLNTVIFDSG
jgi:hypothetical protein